MLIGFWGGFLAVSVSVRTNTGSGRNTKKEKKKKELGIFKTTANSIGQMKAML